MSCSRLGRDACPLKLQGMLAHFPSDKNPIIDTFQSSQSIQQADYVVPVEIEYHWHNVYVIKRPGVDAFLKKMGEIYEIVVFTASLSKVRSIFASAREIGRLQCSSAVRGPRARQARRPPRRHAPSVP